MKGFLRVAALAGVYYLAARVGLTIALEHKLVSLVWPPSGIALAAVLSWGYGVLPGVFIGAAAANHHVVGSLPNALVIGLGNTLEAWAAAWLLRRALRFRRQLDRVVDVLGLVVLGAWLATMIAATIGTGALLIWGNATAERAPVVWLHWWFGDAIGMIILTPVLLILSEKPQGRWSTRMRGEALALGTSLLTVSWVVFHSGEGLPYLVFPFLVWAATRFERKGAVSAILVISAIAVWSTVQGVGPFIRLRADESLIAVQSFMGIVAVTGLVLAAALCERRKNLEARRRLAETELASRQLRFLARASELLGESLEYKSTLQSIVDLIVPEVADYAVAAFYDKEGKIASMISAHRDPAKRELVRQLKDHMPDASRGHPVGEAYLKGKPVLMPRVDSAMLDRIANDPEHRRLTAQLEPASYMAVPLVPREGNRPLGLLVLVRDRYSGLFYTERDLELAQDLAHRCGTAIEHAELFQAAQTAIRARSEFLSVAAHELKTPITVVSGVAYLVSRCLTEAAHGAKADPGLAELGYHAETLTDQTQKLARLVTRLLDVSRVDADKLVVERRWEDLAALLRQVVAAAQLRTDRHVLKLSCPAELRANIDAMRIEQVLINLIDNAIKYSPDGGEIDIVARREHETSLVVSVRDHGLGIDPADMPQIFERFYRVRTTGRAPSGMGLGLFISREIVRRHGGEIQVAAAPGGGTIFTVTIPGAAAPEPARVK